MLNASLAKIMRPSIIWMSMVLLTERSGTDLISFRLSWFLIPCSLIFCMSAIIHWDTMVPPDCTILLEDTITGKSYTNIVTHMYAYAQSANKSL